MRDSHPGLRTDRRAIPRHAMLLAAGLFAANLAQGAAPSAWAQLEKDAEQACVAASGLNNASVHPTTVRFDDSLGIDARLVSGTWKPAHMNGAKALMLCLYDRKSRQATVQEAEAWRATLGQRTTPSSGAPRARAPAPPPVKAPTTG